MLVVPKLLPHVHGQRPRPLPEPDALGAVAAAIAGLAVELTLVLRAVGGVQELVAHCCKVRGFL